MINEELLKFQDYLDACSFITSHILRAHVARIIGLISLIKSNPNNVTENDEILLKLKKEIRDLNRAMKETKKLIAESFLLEDN